MNMDLNLDAVDAQVDRRCDSFGMVSLGELAALLKCAPPAALVQFADGTQPGTLHSYRGHYRMVAVGKQEGQVTVAAFLERVEGAIGREFCGYKGGEYRMNRRTLVWASDYGDNSQQGIVGVEVRDDVATLLLCHVTDDESPAPAAG